MWDLVHVRVRCFLLTTLAMLCMSLFREEDRVAIEKLADSAGVELHLMSNETEEGVAEVKTAACDKLLQARIDARMAGKKVPTCVTREGSCSAVSCRVVSRRAALLSLTWHLFCSSFVSGCCGVLSVGFECMICSSIFARVEPGNGKGMCWGNGVIRRQFLPSGIDLCANPLMVVFPQHTNTTHNTMVAFPQTASPQASQLSPTLLCLRPLLSSHVHIPTPPTRLNKQKPRNGVPNGTHRLEG